MPLHLLDWGQTHICSTVTVSCGISITDRGLCCPPKPADGCTLVERNSNQLFQREESNSTGRAAQGRWLILHTFVCFIKTCIIVTYTNTHYLLYIHTINCRLMLGNNIQYFAFPTLILFPIYLNLVSTSSLLAGPCCWLSASKKENLFILGFTALIILITIRSCWCDIWHMI